MTGAPESNRRGLTTLELTLAIAITAMIALAITGMLAAVAQGVGTRQDSRSAMVGAHAAQSRLSAYIGPSRSVLAASPTELVLWRNDSRVSGTVHATEIRWLRFNAADGAIDVHFVNFPDTWTQVAQDLADLEYTATEDWNSVFTYYQSNGWMLSFRLVDGLEWAVFSIDQATALDSRRVVTDLAFTTHEVNPLVQAVSATVSFHQPPS